MTPAGLEPQSAYTLDEIQTISFFETTISFIYMEGVRYTRFWIEKISQLPGNNEVRLTIESPD